VAATLIDTAAWWAIECGDQPAIVSRDDRVTHAELDEWAEAIAQWLQAQGLQVGDRVTVMAANSLEWCVMAHGVVRAGGLMAPVNPRFTVSESLYMLDRYASKFLFYDEARIDSARALAQRIPALRVEPLNCVHHLRHQRMAERPVRAIDADTPVVIIPTSGSTGFPKGVVYSHRSMVSYITEFAVAEPGVADRPRVLLFGPMSSSAGYVVFTQTMAYGGTIYVEESFDPVRALEIIVGERVTLLQGAPIFYERIAAVPGFSEADISSIRMMQTGGARVSRQLLEAWMDKGVVLRQIYGQTESGGSSSINPVQEAIAQPEKCGRGLPFTRLAVVDAAGNRCPPNVPGQILIKGPGVMVGYWNDPEATAKTLVDGWLHTGDLGVIDENGLLTMLDRLKDIIISGGLNISAAELERVIAEFPGIEEVAVIAAKDERFGETPLAVIHACCEIEVSALVAHCSAQLSDYKVMRYVVLHDEPLPRLATGKISKPELRKQYADAHLTLPRVR
jgi:fatty-acyl-CoA synthase